MSALNARAEQTVANALVQRHGYPPLSAGVTFADLIRRGISVFELKEAFGAFADVPEDVLMGCETEIRYEGYLKRSMEETARAKKLEESPLPADIDYTAISGLRLEAREKLARIRPVNFGQAGRISGVSPADIAVLMIYLSMRKST